MTNEELTKLKKVEKDILDFFADICEKNNLTYYLAYGTLLGAVRHKGFIPWDDDVDVFMPPKDYLKFLDIMKKESNKEYFLQNAETEKFYHCSFSKIRKRSTCMVEENWQWIKINKGINIDIFPLYPCPDDKKIQKKINHKLKFIHLLLSKNNRICSLKNKIIFLFLRIIPRSLTNKIANNMNKKLLSYDKNYNYYKFSTGVIVKKSYFGKKNKLKFENTMYNVPKEYDKILTMQYGDYMKLPPVEKRYGHGKIILSFNQDYETLKGKK